MGRKNNFVLLVNLHTNLQLVWHVDNLVDQQLWATEKSIKLGHWKGDGMDANPDTGEWMHWAVVCWVSLCYMHVCVCVVGLLVLGQGVSLCSRLRS